MVGGKVSIVTELDDSVEVNCIGTGCERYDRCCVRVSKDSRWREIKPGDSFWWQSRDTYWTPRDALRPSEDSRARAGVDYDIKLARVGYSYRPRRAGSGEA